MHTQWMHKFNRLSRNTMLERGDISCRSVPPFYLKLPTGIQWMWHLRHCSLSTRSTKTSAAPDKEVNVVWRMKPSAAVCRSLGEKEGEGRERKQREKQSLWIVRHMFSSLWVNVSWQSCSLSALSIPVPVCSSYRDRWRGMDRDVMSVMSFEKDLYSWSLQSILKLDTWKV